MQVEKLPAISAPAHFDDLLPRAPAHVRERPRRDIHKRIFAVLGRRDDSLGKRLQLCQRPRVCCRKHAGDSSRGGSLCLFLCHRDSRNRFIGSVGGTFMSARVMRRFQVNSWQTRGLQAGLGQLQEIFRSRHPELFAPAPFVNAAPRQQPSGTDASRYFPVLSPRVVPPQ